jgi:LAS superfamily LD-carboxypeptidase LdcB
MTTINLTMKKIKLNTVLMVIVLLLMIAYYLIQNRDKYRNLQNTVTTSQKYNSKNTMSAGSFALDTNVSAAFLTGKFDPATKTEFTEVDLEYGGRPGMYLLKDTYIAFIKMFYAAQFHGVTLSVVSGTRNFDYQKAIWEAKWYGSMPADGKNLAITEKDPVKRAEIILKYTSMPGTSRHHWGTDIDINSIDTAYFETPEGILVYEWLTKNASRYGFCQPFNINDSLKNGYEEEKWHWSYMPLSSIFLKAYGKKVDYSYLTGFAGSETAAKLDVIKNYVLAVNADCK